MSLVGLANCSLSHASEGLVLAAVAADSNAWLCFLTVLVIFSSKTSLELLLFPVLMYRRR